MTRLTLKKPIPPHVRLNLHGVVPERLRGLGETEIAEIRIELNGESCGLGDWFHVEANPQAVITLQGDLRRCDYIAGGLRDGTLRIVGSVGDRLADDMRGGSVLVDGDAGHYAASNLRGGIVVIEGSAGEYAAGAPPGQKAGMRGGTLVIRGACQAWLAARMRRGLVIAQGPVGGGCAARMIAGTVVLGAGTEAPLASGMKRGTILFLGRQDVQPCPGFTKPEACEMAFLPILLRQIDAAVPGVLRDYLSQPRRVVMRSLGDRADAGIGELIWLDSELVGRI